MSEESGSSDRRRQIDALPEPQLRQLLVEVRDHINLRDHGPARVANDRAHDPNSLAGLLEALGEMIPSAIEEATGDVSDEDFARLVERASENWQYSDALVREHREAVATGVWMGRPGKGRPAELKREAVSQAPSVVAVRRSLRGASPGATVELLIDSEEDGYIRAVLVGTAGGQASRLVGSQPPKVPSL